MVFSGWDVYAGELAMMSAFFIFFGYMNFRGMDMASSLQLILAFALAGGVLVLILGSVATETSHVDNLFPLFAEGRSPVACVLSILAITPWLFVGFDTIPQTAEEFDFPPEKSRRLMINSIVCGALLYALVLIAVAIIIPIPICSARITAGPRAPWPIWLSAGSAASSSPFRSWPGFSRA